jgi:hypothetical protein
MPQGVEVQVLSWAPVKIKTALMCGFDFTGAEEAKRHERFVWGLEARLRYFVTQGNKISNWDTEPVRFKSSPGHKSTNKDNPFFKEGVVFV